MGSADHGGVLKLQSPAAEHFVQSVQVIAENPGSFLDLEGLGRVDDVIRGQSIVKPARLGPNFFGDRGGKSDHVMANFRLDLVDPLQVKVGFPADCLGGSFGDQPGISQSLGRGELNFQPFPESILIGPYLSHFGTGVTCNHALISYVRFGVAVRQICRKVVET